MQVTSFGGMACSIAGGLDLFGDRWTLLILRDLMLGLRRHDDIRRSTGIPPTTLSSRLKKLEADGLVARRAYQERPPRQDYVLTEKGRDLWTVILAIAAWGDRHGASGRHAPPMRFVNRATGDDVVLRAVNAKTGAPVELRDLAALPGPGAEETVRRRLALATTEGVQNRGI